MKNLFLIILVALHTNSFAQKANKSVEQKMTIAFNAEQMFEKMGFENVMNSIFEGKLKEKTTSEKNKKEAATMRKSLAAIYGAGIDFKRKICITVLQTTPEDGKEKKYYARNPNVAFIVPVANKQVMMESIKNILNSKKTGQFEKQLKTKGDISYLNIDNAVMLFTNSEFIVAPMMPNYDDYQMDYYQGRTIKVDTIVEHIILDNPNTPDFAAPAKPFNEKLEVIEVDKIISGKVKRAYTYKEKMNDYITTDTAVAITTTVQPPNKVIEDVVMPAPPRAEVVQDVKQAAEEAAKTVKMVEEKDTKTIDTLTRTEYLNDSTKLIIHYVPYEQTQIDSFFKVQELKRVEKQNAKIENFVSNYNSILPYTSKDADIVKVLESKEDIAMLTDTYFGNMLGANKAFGYFYGMTNGKVSLNNNMSYLSFINFENGKMASKFQASCCNENNQYLNNLYLPITSFWPKELEQNKPNFGMLRFNMNLPLFINYYKNILPETEKMEKELTKMNLAFEDISNAFTGEMVLNVGGIDAKASGRKEPQGMFALKVKNISNAVSLMNKIASKNLKMTKNYSFNENGEYIIFSSVDFTKLKKSISPTANTTTLSSGNFGEMKFDIKSLINATTKDSKKKKQEFTLMNDFFGKIEMINNKTEDGNLVGTMTMDMGSNNSNALLNLVQLMQKTTKAKENRYSKEEATTTTVVEAVKVPSKKTTTKKPVAKKAPIKH